MPTIDRPGPYQIFFYSLENGEPPHVHIRRDRATAKVWLAPIAMARWKHFGDTELNAIMRLVRENRTKYLDEWHGFFGTLP